jgi:anti-anti-sigma factor
LATINIEKRPAFPNFSIVSVQGSMDAVACKHVDEKVIPLIDQEAPDLILDISKVDYLSSTGIMSLVKYLVFLTDKKKILRLVKPPEAVAQTLKVVGLEKHFDMCNNVDEALSKERPSPTEISETHPLIKGMAEIIRKQKGS